MKKIDCLYCGYAHTNPAWRYAHGGWMCSKWFTPRKRVNGIESRSMRPDGSIATGLEGIRIRDNRLRSQERLTKNP